MWNTWTTCSDDMNTSFNQEEVDAFFVPWQSLFNLHFLCMFTFICFDKKVLFFLHILHYLLWWWMLLLVAGVIDSFMLFCLIVFSVMQGSVFRRHPFRNKCSANTLWRSLISSCGGSSSLATALLNLFSGMFLIFANTFLQFRKSSFR